MPSWTRSLQFRLTVGFALILTAALLTVSAYASAATQRQVEAFSAEVAAVRAERLNRLVSEWYEQEGGWSGVQLALEQAGKLYDWRVILEDTQGAVIGDSHSTFTREPVIAQRFERRPLIINGKQVGEFFFEIGPNSLAYPLDDHTPFTFNPLGPIGVPVGTVALDTPPVDQSDAEMAQIIQDPLLSQLATSFNRSLFWAGMSAGAVGILLVVLSTRRALRPLRDLGAAAESLAAGDLSHRVEKDFGGEVGALGRAFNEMAESLEDGERERRRVVADIAHELRSPLTNIQGYLEAIKDGVLEPDPETLDTIYSQTKHLGTLVEDLRLLALAEAGTLRLDIVPVDLPSLVMGTIEGFLPRAADRRVDLRFAQDGEVPAVEVDKTRVRQVVSNLVENAITHTPDGGRVTVEVSRPSAYCARIEVKDSGAGIPPEDLPHVFERFYRVDQSRNRATGGAGLGLTIVKRLVELHGGRVAAASDLGHGSVFTVDLPLALSPSPVPAGMD